jgi:1-deoxy-D-xylulose-5-phosphate synthase
MYEEAHLNASGILETVFAALGRADVIGESA